jgi:uncharacterized membrane protein
MEEIFRICAGNAALALEALVVLTIFGGVAETLYVAGRDIALRQYPAAHQLWLRFARWLVLALEFALGADVIRTAVAPTWNDIGQLAAIAAIRTGLNFFLERDIDAAEADRPEPLNG